MVVEGVECVEFEGGRGAHGWCRVAADHSRRHEWRRVAADHSRRRIASPRVGWASTNYSRLICIILCVTNCNSSRLFMLINRCA